MQPTLKIFGARGDETFLLRTQPMISKKPDAMLREARHVAVALGVKVRSVSLRSNLKGELAGACLIYYQHG